MAALTALAMAVGAAASVAGVVSQRKAAKDQKAEIERQKAAAKEAAALESTVSTSDAEFQLGTTDPTSSRRNSGSVKNANKLKPSSGMTTGGITASSVGGL